jgi:hypothetical protein
MSWLRADDVNGDTDGVDQVTFGLDGKAYLIDLGTVNAQKIRVALEPFVKAGFEYAELPTPPDRATPPPAASVPPAATPAPARGRTRPVGDKGAQVKTPGRQRRQRVARPAAASNGTGATSNQTIRAWARENGFPDVSDTGRIRGEIRQAYDAAHAS